MFNRLHGNEINCKKLLPMVLLALCWCQELKAVHVSVSEHAVKHPGSAHVHPPGFHGNDSPHHVVHSSDAHIHRFADIGHIHIGDSHMDHSIGHGNDGPHAFTLSAATRNHGNDIPHDFTISAGTHNHGPDESLQSLGNLDSAYMDVSGNHGDGSHHHDTQSHTPGDHSHIMGGSSPTDATLADTNLAQISFHGNDMPHHVAHQAGDHGHPDTHSHTHTSAIDHTVSPNVMNSVSAMANSESSQDGTFSHVHGSSQVMLDPANILTQENVLQSVGMHDSTGINPVPLTKAYAGNPPLTKTANEIRHTKMSPVDKHSHIGHAEHAHVDSTGNHGTGSAHQALHDLGIEHRHMHNVFNTNHGTSLNVGANQVISSNSNHRNELAKNYPRTHVKHGHLLTNDRNIRTNIEPNILTGTTGGYSQGHVHRAIGDYPEIRTGITGNIGNQGSHGLHSNGASVRINLINSSSSFGRRLARLRSSGAGSVTPSVISGSRRPVILRQLAPTRHSANKLHSQRPLSQRIFMRRRRPNAHPVNVSSLRTRQTHLQRGRKRLRTNGAGTIMQELFGNMA